MDDWDSLETKIRSRLGPSLDIASQVLLSDEFKGFKSCRIVVHPIITDRFYVGVAEKEDQSEYWFMCQPNRANVKFYSSWREYKAAFSRGEIFLLQHFDSPLNNRNNNGQLEIILRTPRPQHIIDTMDDWESLEEKARLLLSAPTGSSLSRLEQCNAANVIAFRGFKYYKVFMNTNERTFGTYISTDAVEYWFVTHTERTDPFIGYFFNWMEYRTAFSLEEVEMLQNLAVPQITDKIAKTELDNTMEPGRGCDWESLEKKARSLLSPPTVLPTSRYLREQAFIGVHSNRFFMFTDRSYLSIYGLAVKKDETEEWFVADRDFRHAQFYKTWTEYFAAFNPTDLEQLKNLGIYELIDSNKKVTDTINKMKLVDTIEEKSDGLFEYKVVLTSLWTRIVKLEETTNKLEKMMTEIYNAPGMPGCLAAQKSFESQQK